jgi:hypothetical protein
MNVRRVFLFFALWIPFCWGNSISEEYVTSLFNGDPENRGSMFVRKVGKVTPKQAYVALRGPGG